MTTKTAKEASMYEPRVGDLVSVEGTACVVIAKVTGGIGVRWADGRGALLGWGFAPLRPDAPGQRVRHEGSPEAGYGRSFHEPDGAPVPVEPGPTCQHCRSGIVAGLLRDTCPRGCDLTLRAAEPEPEIVGTLPWTYANMDAGATMPSLASVHEPVWTAAGRGVAASHPTREGAIAAWREAVQAR